MDAIRDEQAAEPEAPTTTGNVGQNLDELTFTSFYSQELEEAVTSEMKRYSDAEFEQLLEGAKHHPELAKYCEGVLCEGGLDASEWCFGEQEPYEDLVSFMIYLRGKAEMQARLGMQATVIPLTMESVLQMCGHALDAASQRVGGKRQMEFPETQMAKPVPGSLNLHMEATQMLADSQGDEVLPTLPASLDLPDPEVPPCMMGDKVEETSQAPLAEQQPAQHVAVGPIAAASVAPPMHAQLPGTTQTSPQHAAPVASPAALPISTEPVETHPKPLPVPSPTAPVLPIQTPAEPQQAHVPPPAPVLPTPAPTIQQAQQAMPAPTVRAPAPIPKAMIPFLQDASLNNPHAMQPAPTLQQPIASHEHVQAVEQVKAVAAAPVEPARPVAVGKAPAGVRDFNKVQVLPPSTLNSKINTVVEQVKKTQQPNSSTHRKEWATFMRRAQNPSVMPEALIPTFQTTHGKLDIFRLWLEKGMDFSQVEVIVKRRNMERQSATVRDGALNRQQILQSGRYSETDVDDLIRRKTAEGAFIADPNFPQRVDLRKYVINTEVEAERLRSREDSNELVSTSSLTGQEALPLTEAGADFSNVAVPQISAILGLPSTSVGGGGGSGDAGNTQQEKGGKGKGGRRRTGKGKNKGQVAGGGDGGEQEPEPDKPPTPLEKAAQLQKSVLLGVLGTFCALY